MRQAHELSTTTAPAATKRGAHSRDVPPPALKSARSKPWIVSSLSGWTMRRRRARGPRSARWRTGRSRRPRSRARSSMRSMILPTAPVAPTTATRQLLMRTPRTAARGGSCRRPAARTRCAARARRRARGRPAMTQEILIGEVEIISMLIPFVAEHREDLRGDAGMRLHPGADDRDLAHRLVGGDRDAELVDERRERCARAARGRRAAP